MFNKILVCIDGSENALKAAEAACELAKKFDSKVTLIDVYTPVPAYSSHLAAIEVAPVYEEFDPAVEQRMHDTVEHRTGKIFTDAGLKYDTRREIGHPVDKIVDAAANENADLIVMGSRGLGDFQRFLLGSVSDGVLHHAHCPVLIIR